MTSQQLTGMGPSDGDRVRPFPEACHIALDLVDVNPEQPRQELSGIEELAAHIRIFGVLQPIVVSRATPDRYVLIAGHRRLAAVRWLAANDTYPARWRDIPAIVRAADTSERLVLALAENVSRHALSDAEVVTALRLVHDLHGWSQAEVARRLGVSPQWINQFARVLADSELTAHLQSGQLSTAKAYEVLRAQTPGTRQAALEAALRGAALRTVREIAAGAVVPLGAGGGAGESPPAASSDWMVSGGERPDAKTASSDWMPANDSGNSGSRGSSGNSEGRRGRDAAGDTGDEATAEEHQKVEHVVELRSLAVYSLLGEAKRHRLVSLPRQTVRSVLLQDLKQIGESG
jgi:ParB/RepB/Spo0J family partition protein